MAGPQDREATERLDALRRGLYRPGSTEADLRQYLAEREAVAPEAPVDEPAPPAQPRPRRRWLLAVGAGLAVVLGVALVVALGERAPTRVVATPTARATTAADPILIGVGDGQTLAVLPGSVLRSTPTATSVRGRPVVGRLVEGRGNAVFAVGAPDSRRGGSAVVVISSNARVPVAWRALSRLPIGRAFSEPMVLARGVSAEPSGTSAPQTFEYRAELPPSRVAVAAPPGSRWSLLIGVATEDQTLH
ncbi:hypothetical protein GCM10025783_11730 [Amnibacterium soli]|uniref:DUF1707 domain-containing protein n=1 Tax=Amnibacterium soli TaxID=1282736 RepID=A0ABP8YX48_9MICO